MMVYIAAPLFSSRERDFNVSLSGALDARWVVHLPQRDGPLVEERAAIGADVRDASRAAYESDVSAIRRCDALIAVLEGRALDEGVCIEVGFAKALGKYIVGFKSDTRQVLPWGNNPMVDGCVDEWVGSLDELSQWSASWLLGRRARSVERLPKTGTTVEGGGVDA